MESAARNDIRLMWIKDESKVFLDKKYLNDEYRPHNLIKIANKSYMTKAGEILEYIYTDKFNKDYYYSKNLVKKVIHEENLSYQKEAITNLTSDLEIELRI